jgi:hypothetical protein
MNPPLPRQGNRTNGPSLQTIRETTRVAADQKDLASFLTCDPLFDPLRPYGRHKASSVYCG